VKFTNGTYIDIQVRSRIINQVMAVPFAVQVNFNPLAVFYVNQVLNISKLCHFNSKFIKQGVLERTYDFCVPLMLQSIWRG
jgi:hypothetical protein